MSLLSFIQDLPAVLERRQVMNVVDQLKLEYDDTISPILDDIRETFQGKPMKSMLNKRMDTITRRFVSFKFITVVWISPPAIVSKILNWLRNRKVKTSLRSLNCSTSKCTLTSKGLPDESFVLYPRLAGSA